MTDNNAFYAHTIYYHNNMMFSESNIIRFGGGGGGLSLFITSSSVDGSCAREIIRLLSKRADIIILSRRNRIRGGIFSSRALSSFCAYILFAINAVQSSRRCCYDGAVGLLYCFSQSKNKGGGVMYENDWCAIYYDRCRWL